MISSIHNFLIITSDKEQIRVLTYLFKKYTPDAIVQSSHPHKTVNDTRDLIVINTINLCGSIPPLVENIRKHNPNIPILFLIDSYSEIITRLCLKHPSTDFITYPIHTNEFMFRIKALINSIHENEKTNINAIIAHDLRSPVATLKMIAQTIDFTRITDSDLLSKIQMFSTVSDELYNLLENLLRWNLSQKKKNINPTSFDLSHTIKSVQTLFSVATAIKNIHVITNIPNEISVFADEDMIYTVLRNLYSNAIKYTPQNGEIKISVSPYINKVSIIISDNGIGMTPENLEQYNKQTSHEGTFNEHGFGIGLQISKNFIQKNGGELSISSNPQKGSSFEFSIPLKT